MKKDKIKTTGDLLNEHESDVFMKSSNSGRITVALMGNPNSGKTSLFNTLTGSHQHVGNWAGVTVEIKEGEVTHDGVEYEIIDLPGTYSLTAFSMEERVARDFLIQNKPDVVINVIDATNLERNLYLTVQMLELGIRPMLALNMWDEVKEKGIKIDVEYLSELLGVVVVSTVGKTGSNIKKLLEHVSKMAKTGECNYRKHIVDYPLEIQLVLDRYKEHEAIKAYGLKGQWTVLKLLEKDSRISSDIKGFDSGEKLLSEIHSEAQKIESVIGEDTESLIAEARYGFIAGLLKQIQIKPVHNRVEISDQIDRVLTHPVWAFPVFFLFMWLLFQSTFVLGAYPQAFLKHIVDSIAKIAMAIIPASILRDCLVEGVIGGVGGVVIFLPNILILFFGIAIMEDTGYMARAAFITDKIMHRVGLHGKSFIPMIMGMGCNVPAIMAARTLESDVDRKKTILLSPLISCSARLPVYVLFAGSLFPHHAGNIIFLFQFVFGTVAFFIMAWVFKKTIFKGEAQPFVMELPPYRLPTLQSVLIHMWQRSSHFLKKMGGVVLLFSVVLWFLSAFPKDKSIVQKYERSIDEIGISDISDQEKAGQLDSIESIVRTELMSRSYIGKIGLRLEPIFKPLGFDWRAAVALVTGFVAKEVVVSSMGVLYGADNDGIIDEKKLSSEIANNFTPLSAFSFLIFVLLYTPCIVTVVTQVRELNSVGWSIFSIAYQPLLAWIVAFVVFQGGRLLGLE